MWERISALKQLLPCFSTGQVPLRKSTNAVIIKQMQYGVLTKLKVLLPRIYPIFF